MERPLCDLTLSELWDLFPIELVAHRDCWRDWFEEEKRRLLAAFGHEEFRISHVGSTAIPNILAKPIVDILVEIPGLRSLQSVGEDFVCNGYIAMATSADRVDLNKGYTPSGYAQRVFHAHVRRWGDNDELYFRDWLVSHPDDAQAYERLKANLLAKDGRDRDAYTEAKGSFVRCLTSRAKEEYAGRW